MTAEDRYIVDLGDIRMVRLECGTCGATLSFRLSLWSKVPHECPGCAVMFHHGDVDSDVPMAQVIALSRALRGSVAVADKLPFKVRLELERPKS